MELQHSGVLALANVHQRLLRRQAPAPTRGVHNEQPRPHATLHHSHCCHLHASVVGVAHPEHVVELLCEVEELVTKLASQALHQLLVVQQARLVLLAGHVDRDEGHSRGVDLEHHACAALGALSGTKAVLGHLLKPNEALCTGRQEGGDTSELLAAKRAITTA